MKWERINIAHQPFSTSPLFALKYELSILHHGSTSVIYTVNIPSGKT